jgi:hypothetical protein
MTPTPQPSQPQGRTAEVINITWRGERGDYGVSIPEWEGGEVVRLQDYAALVAENRRLREALEDADQRLASLNTHLQAQSRNPTPSVIGLRNLADIANRGAQLTRLALAPSPATGSEGAGV